jgi:hypothetical protein
MQAGKIKADAVVTWIQERFAGVAASGDCAAAGGP